MNQRWHSSFTFIPSVAIL
uniref:Uncharacterized protein n=1 Tax=Arundo donax TaxID=35708 RepID=A0A0A9EME7_ARUDO